MAEEIVIDVVDGDIVVAGKGIKGSECKSLTAEFEREMGRVEASRKTAEYFESPGVKRKAGA